MKRILSLLVILLALSAYAENEYIPCLQEGNAWVFENTPPGELVQRHIGGTKVIDGVEYHVLYKTTFHPQSWSAGEPIEAGCGCPACQKYSRAYIRHLFKAKEMLGMRLCVLHNLYFYNNMMEEIREALDNGNFEAFRREYSEKLSRRI